MENFDDKYKKKNPFSAPDGYFDRVTDDILNRVEKGKAPQKPRIIEVMRPYLGLAGIFLLALFVVQAIFPLFVDENKMLMKDAGQVVQVQELAAEENVLDSDFNPTNEEIIEYLASEIAAYELFYADLY